MKTPEFWKYKSLFSFLLRPFGWIYSTVTTVRFYVKKPFKAPVPVICVGNLTAGGTGKTPVALSLAQILQDLGRKPYFITRGYGGKIKNIMVDLKRHAASEVGDEPLLLAEQAPTAINPDRAAAAKLAFANGADILVMDDGFQNPGLDKDLSFLVFDGAYGIGNGSVIPSGPLRETLKSGLKRASAIIIMNGSIDEQQALVNSLKIKQLPVFFAETIAILPDIFQSETTADAIEGQSDPLHIPMSNKALVAEQAKVLAFAGIGHPQKFYKSLASCGIQVAKTVNFPDHHFYSRAKLKELIDEAQRENWRIFTTSKDFVKIDSDLRKYFNVLKIDVKWQNREQLIKFINQKIKR